MIMNLLTYADTAFAFARAPIFLGAALVLFLAILHLVFRGRAA